MALAIRAQRGTDGAISTIDTIERDELLGDYKSCRGPVTVRTGVASARRRLVEICVASSAQLGRGCLRKAKRASPASASGLDGSLGRRGLVPSEEASF